MLSLIEYISKRKNEDKIDEFDFKKHSENMASVIKYVTDYFNNYLNLEDYDYEQMKIQETINKFKGKVMKTFPLTGDYVISYYLNKKKRLDKYVGKAFEEVKDSELFYEKQDFEMIAKYVIEKKLDVSFEQELFNTLVILAQEYREANKESPAISEMRELDNELVAWVKAVFRNYNVNLLSYASEVSFHYYETYIDTEYDRSTETFYRINRYDYRYQENPFNINDIYLRNEHREFIKGRKGELEMLIMYFWLDDEVKDMDYWPEYVQLCISTNRVKLAKSKRILIPVETMKLNYPGEIESSFKYIETSNGIIKENPGNNYILRLSYGKRNDEIWKDKDLLKSTIENMKSSFGEYGAPSLVEFQSPFKTVQYGEEAFFRNYQVLEKELRRFTDTKIAIINGCFKSNKGKEYLFSTIEDIVRLRNTCKELKLKLKLAIDFTDFNKKNILKENMVDTINSLATMRNFVIGIHLDSIDKWGGYRSIYNNDNRYEYISVYDYPTVSAFVQGLATIIQDSVPRYFIPEKVKDSETLEELIDLLYRGGFTFKKEENL
ncbi:hypothetical protein [Clostridium sp.]|uniref:hypothetical protein n=1 Tax=Clostridium sp. TaxID=1506 RepID=UPI0034643A57